MEELREKVRYNMLHMLGTVKEDMEEKLSSDVPVGRYIDNVMESISSYICERDKNVNRVEVIDDTGRVYVNWDEKNKVTVDYQDEGKTLKVFIRKEKE
jgi:hypothetical protein